jgi:hypothetical protein
MKIINQTSSQILIATPKNSFTFKIVGFVSSCAFASIFTFIPATILNLQLSQIGILKINCDRVEPKQVNCQFSKSQYFDLVKQANLNYQFVNSVKYNVIDEGEDGDGEQVYRYNFSLLTKFGEKVPFKSMKSAKAREVTATLNSFLASPKTSFRYISDSRYEPTQYISSIFLIPFFAVGFAGIWTAFSIWVDAEEITLDKYEYQLKHSKRTLLGTKVNQFALNEIAKIDVLYTTDSYDNVSYTPRITVSSNQQFKLEPLSDRQVAIKIVNDLNRFVGLPEEEDPVVKK